LNLILGYYYPMNPDPSAQDEQVVKVWRDYLGKGEYEKENR